MYQTEIDHSQTLNHEYLQYNIRKKSILATTCELLVMYSWWDVDYFRFAKYIIYDTLDIELVIFCIYASTTYNGDTHVICRLK